MRYTFGSFDIDVKRREITAGDQIIIVEPQVFDLLIHFIKHRDRVVSKDELFAEIWKRKFVSDAALSSRVRDLRAALGDSGKAQSIIKTVHGLGFRFLEDVVTYEDRGPGFSSQSPENPSETQEIQYVRSFDGCRIAYSDMGAGEIPIVKTANWMSHLEYDLESPVWRHWISALCGMSRLVRYDERGNGMSERDVSEVSHEDCVRDLESLVDELGLQTINLFGISQGASVAIDYAVRHPQKVNKIVIYGGFAKGWRFHQDDRVIGQRVAMSMLMETGWGQHSHEFRQLFTSRFMPEATPEQADWFNELQRKSVAPRMAARLHNMFGSIDVSHLLPMVSVPTLVLHARGDREISVDAGRDIATDIPGARFVTLESQNHIMLESEPAFSQLVQTVQSFLKE